MTIRTLSERGCSRREIARAAGVSERQVRYELGRDLGIEDGRARQPERASRLGEVMVLDRGEVVAEHPRDGSSLLVRDLSHYEGASTGRVLAPAPLGRMGRRLEEIGAMADAQQ